MKTNVPVPISTFLPTPLSLPMVLTAHLSFHHIADLFPHPGSTPSTLTTKDPPKH